MPAQAHEPYVAKAWGANANGELGDNTDSGPETCQGTEGCSTSAVEVQGLSGVSALAGGKEDSLAIREGTVYAWGEDTFGQLGNGNEPSPSSVPTPVCAVGTLEKSERGAKHEAPGCPGGPFLTSVKGIAAGHGFALALLNDGTVVAWGNNNLGQLGDGSTTSRDVPVPVNGLTGVVSIAAGQFHSLALLGDGTVMAWGSNVYGQLGAGSTTDSHVPVPVCAPHTVGTCSTGPLLSGVKAVSAGGAHSLALLESGEVAAWGHNEQGELGDGTTTDSDVPVRVSNLSHAVAVAAGEAFSLAEIEGGWVEAWGNNGEGQLGRGAIPGPEPCPTPPSSSCSKVPLPVTGLAGHGAVTALSAGGEHSLVLLGDGTLMAWGENAQGQLGDGTSLGPELCGTTACSNTPVAVSKVRDAKGIAAGAMHSLAFGPAPPTVAAINPHEGRKKGAGTRVTITGAEFEGATEVKFGSAKAPRFTVSSQGSITAVAPSGKGTVDVTVTTPAGTSATSEADRFNYSRPTVKKISPRTGPELGGTMVTIAGTNFASVTAVKFGSTEASRFAVKSETEIVAVSPAHEHGKVDVTVATPDGTSSAAGRDRFKYM